MKIQKKDLDQEILNSLNIVDSLRNNFTVDSGFVAFNGKELYVKEFKDPNARKLTSYSHIREFNEHRYVSNDIYTSSFQNVLSETPLNKFRSSLVQPKNEVIFKSISQIMFTKKISNFLYVLSAAGIFYKYDVDNCSEVYEIDFSKMMKDLFAITIDGCEISDIVLKGEDLYISTYKHGIYLLNEATRSLQLAISEPGVIKISIIGNQILCFSEMLHIYSLETNGKTEKINFYKNEKIMNILTVEDKCFVICRSLGAFASDKVVHLLELDEIGSVVLSDNRVAKNPRLNSYDVLWSNTDGEHVYVSGIKNSHAFIWEYNVKNPIEFREIIIDQFDSENVLSVEKYFENFVIYTKDHIVVVKNGEIKNNFAIPNVVEEVIFSHGKYFIRSSDVLLRLSEVEYRDSNSAVLLADFLKDCNEMEVCVNADCKVSFISDSGEKLIPVYQIKYRGVVFSKLTIPADVSKVNILLDDIQGSVDSVIIKKNRIFYK